MHGIAGLPILNYSRRNRLVNSVVMLWVERTQSGVHFDIEKNILSDDGRSVEEKDANACDHGAETLKPREVVKANAQKNADNCKGASGADHDHDV